MSKPQHDFDAKDFAIKFPLYFAAMFSIFLQFLVVPVLGLGAVAACLSGLEYWLHHR